MRRGSQLPLASYLQACHCLKKSAACCTGSLERYENRTVLQLAFRFNPSKEHGVDGLSDLRRLLIDVYNGAGEGDLEKGKKETTTAFETLFWQEWQLKECELSSGMLDVVLLIKMDWVD